MSATVTSLFEHRARHSVSDLSFLREHIRGELIGKCDPSLIPIAQSKAVRHLNAGMQPDKAIAQVIKWAKCVVTNPEPPAAA